jgi:hypothetical protein
MDQFKDILHSHELQTAAKQVAFQTLGHPLDFARTLMQVCLK